MLYGPSSFVVSVFSRFVPVLRTFTVALATTAPELSVTVPLMAPSVCCAQHGRLSNTSEPRNTNNERRTFSIRGYPSSPTVSFEDDISHHCRPNRLSFLWISAQLRAPPRLCI